MINFQEAMSRLLTPASVSADWALRPAIVQTGLKTQGSPDKITTFAELQAMTARVSAEYSRAGVANGDVILLCAANSAELVAGILAAWASGATAIPVDFRLTQPEVENIAHKVNAKVVYCPRFKLADLFNLDHAVFAQVNAEPDANLLRNVKPESLGLVILTSGTTGMPKGAVHDLGSLVSNFVEIGEVFGLKPATSALLPLPVSHIFGIEVMLAFLNLGGSVIFSDFSPTEFWTTVGRLTPSLVVGVPTIYGALLSLPHPGTVCESVDFYLSGGAALPPSLSQQFEKSFGRHIIQGYGATETKITTINKGGPVSSIGRAIPSAKVEIVDEQDNVLPEGATGELRISGHCLMKGYLNQPDVTASVLHDGHYHTGDIGHIEDGWIFISGRSKEMINVAGNKVFPAEVESVLREHPFAQEVAVIGVPHKKLGQIVKAVVVVPSGQWSDRLAGDHTESKSAEEELRASLREFCAQNLKRELRPMDWEFRPASNPLPKTHTGKVDKKQLQTVHA